MKSLKRMLLACCLAVAAFTTLAGCVVYDSYPGYYYRDRSYYGGRYYYGYDPYYYRDGRYRSRWD